MKPAKTLDLYEVWDLDIFLFIGFGLDWIGLDLGYSCAMLQFKLYYVFDISNNQ